MVIERGDNTINLFEMKFSEGEFLMICFKHHLFNILHQRILAVMQVEVYANHVVDVGIALHLYVSGLAVHHRVAARRIRYKLDEVFGRIAAHIIDAYAVFAVPDGSYLRQLLGMGSSGIYRVKLAGSYRVAVMLVGCKLAAGAGCCDSGSGGEGCHKV